MGRHPYDTDYELGEDNITKFGLDFHNPVFPLSALFSIAFITLTLLYPDTAFELLNRCKTEVIELFDSVFMLSANSFVIFCLILALSPLGSIRLGGPSAKPDYSYTAWFAMLFSAGMGIGLMFWSVAEPLAYVTGWAFTPLNVEANSEQAYRVAMAATLFHWTIHPWAIYAVVGLSLAFFYYSKQLPLTIRSTFYPIFSERIWGWPGHIIDTLAVIATIFGLATSLGLGAQQAASGMHVVFGFDNSTLLQLLIIGLVTAAAIVSVVRGLDGGVKVLSQLNIAIACLLLLFVLLLGETSTLLVGIGENLIAYFDYVLPLSAATDRTDESWQHSWTVFYLAWWISWSPFVGMFIARISKGRTVRAFIFSVLIVPSLVTLVWMTVFGESALLQYKQQIGGLSEGVGDVSLAMFALLAELPWAGITSLVAIVLVLAFFITSSDSGSLVIDSITAGGKIDSPVSQRVFWALAEGAVAIVLLLGGGSEALTALQAGTVSAGLPFTFVLILMCLALTKALFNEYRQQHGLPPILPPDGPDHSQQRDK